MDIRSFVSSPGFSFLFLFIAALAYFLVLWGPTVSPSEGFLVLASARAGSAHELPAPAPRAGTTGAVRGTLSVELPAPLPPSMQSRSPSSSQPVLDPRGSSELLAEPPDVVHTPRRLAVDVGEEVEIYVGDLEDLDVQGDAFSVQRVRDGVISLVALREGMTTLRSSAFELEFDARGSVRGSELEADYESVEGLGQQGAPDGVGLVELEVGDAYSIAIGQLRAISVGNGRVIDVEPVFAAGSSADDVLVRALRPGYSSLELGELQLGFRVHPAS